MEKSYSDYLVEIEELTEGNDLMRSLLLDNFYKNLPDDINKNNKRLLNQLYFPLKRKEMWQCGHENCEIESCYSHEISENLFLKHLADLDSNVVIIEKNISGNAFFYYEKEVHKRNASNFPGYCSEHDSKLFSDIENCSPSLNVHFVNKQCLRSIRRKKFDLLLQVRGAEKFLDGIEDELLDSPLVKQVVQDFERKKQILLERVSVLSEVYDKVYAGINNQDYCIKYSELGQPKLGYCFSEVFDCTMEEDTEECILFWFKIDFFEDSKAFVCWLDNETSKQVATQVAVDYKRKLIDLMYVKKEKLVFSSEFLSQMNRDAKDIFLQNDELYNLGPIENMLLIQEFF
ncbi:TPA: hypothetical protein NG558_004657 [Vibrio parahaemolyticus]|nr:hypothetical protein [Vibrio parahaemolyticus]EJT0911526.1 hypothetical protein [Vibrio parahaemolyticus]ELA7934873.1 hypothetical protein [Vibrio parahaemolyticus]HCE3304443.1 hypothetical protein [Vibrio parahaemolyticus]HCH6003626.1 hypothetical protein [Vibrio parahaemolyticus]